ncbi:hypothetical protein FF47_60 [Mycobacterium phage FF47]|nr:hypothetical protein FF47_60 [Mycobacterium phage FF47]AGI12332.1 hypothetical protein FF47_60 [Mycobacterium phage FF47]WKV22124.1 hypothetical protein 8UZL_00006 [Mycobacteroides phage 8UZL]
MIRIPTYHKRQVRRTLGVMAAGAVLAGVGLAAASHADASPGLSKSELICNMLDEGDTILTIGMDLVIRYNIGPEDAGEAIGLAALTECPEHYDEVMAQADELS